MPERKQPNDYAAAYARLIAQIGCITSITSLAILAVAFAAGWFLDDFLGTRGIFTVLLLAGSFPVTLYVIMRVALMMAARAQQLSEPIEKKDNLVQEEETAT